MATPWLEKAEGFISCPQEDTHARLNPEVLKKQTKVVSREQSEGHTSTPYEDTKASSAQNISASLMLSKSEGINIRVRDVSSITWSSPLVTMSVPPSIFSHPASIPNPHTQHNLRLDPPPITPSRFASVNPFTVLSDFDDSPPAPVESSRATPIPTQALSSISAPPIIADTGCTGLLLQFSNLPALSPFSPTNPCPLFPSLSLIVPSYLWGGQGI